MTPPADTESRLIDAVRSGDRRALPRAISMVDHGHAELTSEALLLSRSGCWVLGVTGAPGVGKSTFVGALLDQACKEGRKVAVLAVDPSSVNSGGALLGDRVRMLGALDDHPEVYMRSLATRAHLGGISRSTPATINLLAAAGYDLVIVETVGVGQAELEIMNVADTVLVLVQPEGGDWLQAAKSGVMEVGDVFGVNKADRPGAQEMTRELRAALHLRMPSEWSPPIVAFSALENTGLDKLWEALQAHRAYKEKTARQPPRSPLRDMAHAAVDAALDVLDDSSVAFEGRDDAALLRTLADALAQERD